MFKKLGFETATYPPFCTMSWNILFFWTASLSNYRRTTKIKHFCQILFLVYLMVYLAFQTSNFVIDVNAHFNTQRQLVSRTKTKILFFIDFDDFQLVLELKLDVNFSQQEKQSTSTCVYVYTCKQNWVINGSCVLISAQK